MLETRRQRRKTWRPPKGKTGENRTKKLLPEVFFVNISTLLLTLLTHGAITISAQEEGQRRPQRLPESL